MDRIPYSAIPLAIGMLIIIWFLLLDRILSQTPDAHLQFLLDRMGINKKEDPNDFSNLWVTNTFIQVITSCGQAAGEPRSSSPAPKLEGARRG